MNPKYGKSFNSVISNQVVHQHHHLIHPVCSSTPTMTTLTSPASVTPGDDASQLFQQQRHMGDDGQPKMEYSAYGAPQVMQGYNPDMGDGSGSQGSQSYGATAAAKEEPIYATPSESDVSGASSSTPLATLADYNQVPYSPSSDLTL